MNKRGFASRTGYILSLAGFCIGIGNMWKFPYIVGANGGGAFLIVYVILAMFVGVPLFIVETTLGRTSQLSGIAGMRKLSGEKGGWFWSLGVGWLGVASVFLICCYFWTIMGWNVGYIWMVASGELYGIDNEAASQVFNSFSGSGSCVLCCILCAAIVWTVMNTGVKRGVEKLCTFAMPLLVILLLGLAVYANTLPGSHTGLMWYLTPDFKSVDFLQIFQAAAVQVFYSIGVGMCCGFVYGSYTGRDAAMVTDTAICGALNTLVATLAGLTIIPALFAFDIEPTSGPSLIFVTLPQMFSAMGNVTGRVFGSVFLIAVFLACITSIVGVIESLVANLVDEFGWKRKTALRITMLSTVGLSVIITLNQGTGLLSHFRAFGMDIFSIFDCVSSAFGLTIGTALMLAFVLFKWGFERFRREANLGSEGTIRIYSGMKWYYQAVLPVVLLFIIYCILNSYFG